MKNMKKLYRKLLLLFLGTGSFWAAGAAFAGPSDHSLSKTANPVTSR